MPDFKRYLAFLSELIDPSADIRDVEKLSEPIKKDGRSFPRFNLFSKSDLGSILSLVRGESAIRGITNKMLRNTIRDKSEPQVSRLLKRMRVHGLIKKVEKTFRYYLTALGRRSLLTALKLRELVIIPSLAGVPVRVLLKLITLPCVWQYSFDAVFKVQLKTLFSKTSNSYW